MGILATGILVFAAPILVMIALGDVGGLFDVGAGTWIVLILLSAMPAAAAGIFLVPLPLHGPVGFWMTHGDGLFVVDPQKCRITDGLGRCLSDHGQGILVRGRGGNAYFLVLSASDGPPTALPILRRLAFSIDRRFVTLWSGYPDAKLALPLFLPSDAEATLAAARP